MKIVVLAGGISTERNVSLCSGRQVYEALKKRGHQVVMLDVFMGYKGNPEKIFELDRDWAEDVFPVSTEVPNIEDLKKERGGDPDVLLGENVLTICKMADIAFLALHGDCGENGKIQGTFDLHSIKYTGTDALSSAIAMDKMITKKLFMSSGVDTPRYCEIFSPDSEVSLEFPAVVKVNSGGSSVGVYIVKNMDEYKNAVKEAFSFGDRVFVEEYIKGREFTDAVVEGIALPVVEIAPVEGFYDYKNKYQPGSTVETCPADIPEDVTSAIQNMARKAYEALGIKVYARMDFMLSEDNRVYCLEANTLPGMTPTSLVPQEAAAIGKDFADLCEWIIEISLKKYN